MKTAGEGKDASPQPRCTDNPLVRNTSQPIDKRVMSDKLMKHDSRTISESVDDITDPDMPRMIPVVTPSSNESIHQPATDPNTIEHISDFNVNSAKKSNHLMLSDKSTYSKAINQITLAPITQDQDISPVFKDE